jgi:outer membrane protein assembly factor BamA
VDAERPERLEPVVGLRPGQPLDPEAVRRAVELIYATGRFEDVRVELERTAGQDGVTVVFRPRPAPLLVAIEVEGDRALSPSALRRVARLRPGEALWRSRLERAGRDVGLALKRRGYLEALVEPEAVRVPGGADILFRVHAGPRVRVGRTALDGGESAGALGLLELARPHPGEIYRRDRADSACEAMRRRLAQAGHWRAEVEARETYDPGHARMDLVFHVRPGPRTRLEVRGTALGSGTFAALRDLVRDGRASADALEAGAERIESQLRRLGYREAHARATAETRPWGEAIVYAVNPGAKATVASVVVRGADAALVEGLRTRPGEALEDAVLEEDRRAIVRRLEEGGHFEARVDADVAEGGGELPVVFVAHPGVRADVSGVDVVGPDLPASSEDEGPRELTLRPGLPYRLRDVAADRETLLAAWHRAGYLDAHVRPELGFSADRTAVKVSLVAEPGPRTIVDHVVLAGLVQTREATVEREMVLRPGESFSFERVLESQRRLSALGIFERVAISEIDPSRERRRDVVVRVEEAPTTAISWGVGYSEQDRLRGSVEVSRRNLGGLGRTASVFLRGSFRGSRFLLNLREPWLFGRQLDSFLTGFWEEESLPSFDYNRKGAIVQVGRTFDRRATFILRYLHQDTHVYNIQVPPEQIDRQYRTYTVSGPAASVVWDSRDDPLEPRRGLFLSADLQMSAQPLGGVSYLKGFFQATGIRRLRADLVFVLSGRLGLSGTFGDEGPLLPLPERFFAGGDYGPRGFPVDGVGPQFVGSDGKLYPTGGNALLLGGAELRYDVRRSLQLAGFLDLGNVYPEVRDLGFSDLRRSAGLGVRYKTPIGPIRLDWGYVLDRRPGESSSHVHLTIGHAF